MMVLYAIALSQAELGPYALPSLPGVPENVVWGMSPNEVIAAGDGKIHVPTSGSVEAVLPGPRGLHIGAQAEDANYTVAFYFSPLTNRLSATLVTLSDGTREGSKCLPWLSEIRASLGDPIGTQEGFRTVTVTWRTLTANVTYEMTYRKKRTGCS